MSEVTTIGSKHLRTSSQRWWLMVLLVTGMVICYAQRGALPFAAPTLIKELHISKTDMGFLLSTFFFLYSFMQMPAGWLVDRFGVKKAYALGFIVWSIASACTGLAGGFYTLIVFQLILGVGQSVAFPASAAAVANWFQNKERGIVTASYLTGVRIGQALAGVRIVAIVSADVNLADTNAARRSEIIIGENASDAQSRAMLEALKSRYAVSLGKIISVRRGPLTFEHENKTYKVSADDFASINIEAMPDDLCCKMPQLVWYSPLVPLENRKVGYTTKALYAGAAVGDPWQTTGQNSAFYGSFAL